MEHCTEATDGSSIEIKERALVWHHQEAEPDFEMWEAKELLDHLESILANEPVVVKRGQQIVEQVVVETASFSKYAGFTGVVPKEHKFSMQFRCLNTSIVLFVPALMVRQTSHKLVVLHAFPLKVFRLVYTFNN